VFRWSGFALRRFESPTECQIGELVYCLPKSCQETETPTFSPTHDLLAQEVLKGTSAGALQVIQRMVLMAAHVAGQNEAALELFARNFGPVVLHPGEGKGDVEVCARAFLLLCKDPAFFFQAAYVPTKARLGQGLHYLVGAVTPSSVRFHTDLGTQRSSTGSSTKLRSCSRGAV
jgi:hypothetical protein